MVLHLRPMAHASVVVFFFVGSLGVALLAEAGQFSVQIVYEEWWDQKRPKLPQILSGAHF